MASPHLVSTIKQQATRLQTTLECLGLPRPKRTQALEFVSRHLYGYNSWNSATGNGKDHTIDTRYTALLRQVAALCLFHPKLTYGIADLQFQNDVPRIMHSNRFRHSAVAIASLFSPDKPHNFIWEDLLVDRYVPVDLIERCPPAIRPRSNYQAVQMFEIQIEYSDREDSQWVPGRFPWDRFEKRLRKQGAVKDELISSLREMFREAHQHSWDNELKLFCGLYDEGQQLELLALKWPDEMQKVARYLLDHDGGRYDPQAEA